MRIRTWWRHAALGAVAAASAALVSPEDLSARPARRTTSGSLKLTNIDLGTGFAGVPHNQIVTMTFTAAVDPATVGPATIQIRAANAQQTGFTIQVPGAFQVAGSVVRFFPRLPTHLRMPTDPSRFYPPGSPQDDASANAAFRPNRGHEITIVGAPAISAVGALRGRALDRTYRQRF